jgi:cytochrome c oxidase assembly protein subunit 15
MSKNISKVLLITVCFALFVVTLGAYTRLTDAGLGCPDWPGCYGHMVLPNKGQSLVEAQNAYPTIPIEQKKAWTEMAHRYAVGFLSIFILFIALYALRAIKRKQPFPRVLPFVLIGLLAFQAALGMWTVTLKLLPVVVMGHLLGGLTILASLWWCYLSLKKPSSSPQDQKFKPWVILGGIIVFCQIALGGWVSANYAGISCVGFPSCNGKLIPELDMQKAFNVKAPIGNNYQGGVLESTPRITIQFVHRIGAMITFSYILLLSLTMIMRGSRTLKILAGVSLTLVMIQFALGVINVVRLLPLSIAVAHNGFAAMLLLSMLALIYYVRGK